MAQGVTKSDIDTLLHLDKEEDMKLIAQGFVEENQELFEMVADRLIGYAKEGNSLSINWMCQSLLDLIKQANASCKVRLGISPEKMQ